MLPASCSGSNEQCRLISASVGTIVHYGFQCDSVTHDGFLSLCLVMGILGTILPFMDWFNDREYRVRDPFPRSPRPS